MSERYFILEQLAERWHCSTRSVQERAARGLVPHRRLVGMRRILVPVDELEAFEAGDTELETLALPGGGRIVRVKSFAARDASQSGGAS